MYITILIWLAILPGIVLLWNIYRQDKIEKEPIGLLVKIFLISILTTIATIIVEVTLDYTVLAAMTEDTLWYHFINNFFCVALIEELFKFLAGRIPTWKNKEFNYLFDGVVYMVTSAVSFAILENILYCITGGIGVAIMRALTSVPSHTIDGIFMGYFYGKAKYAAEHEDILGKRKQLFLALFVPVCLHGFYDFCLSVGNALTIVTFFVFIIALYIYTFIKQRKMAKEDSRIFDQEPEIPVGTTPPGKWDPTPYMQDEFISKNKQE